MNNMNLRGLTIKEKGLFYMHVSKGLYWNESKNAWHCSLYDSVAPIHKVKITEDLSGKSQYWAWFENEKQDYEMVWPKKLLAEMCFPYGSKIEEDRGRGKLTCVNIEFVEIVKE